MVKSSSYSRTSYHNEKQYHLVLLTIVFVIHESITIAQKDWESDPTHPRIKNIYYHGTPIGRAEMFESDVDVYAELRNTVPRYSKQIFLRFGVNCFGRHWTRIRSETRVPAPVAKRVKLRGDELARELIPLGEELTTHDLGAIGLIHDDWFSLGREEFWRDTLIETAKRHPRIFKSMVILASRPPSAFRVREILRPKSVSGFTTKMILRRAEKWRNHLLPHPYNSFKNRNNQRSHKTPFSKKKAPTPQP